MGAEERVDNKITEIIGCLATLQKPALCYIESSKPPRPMA
jgi:hypothetical protein